MNRYFILLLFCFFSDFSGRAEELIVNGGFESGTNAWRTWSREAGVTQTRIDDKIFHAGRSALYLQHDGEQDWSLEPGSRLNAKPGDLLELEVWVKVRGSGSVTLCASTWDGQGRVIAWSAGQTSADASSDWQHLVAHVIASENVSLIQPRLIGAGRLELWVDDYSVTRGVNLSSLRPPTLRPLLEFSNAAIQVSFDTTNATFSVRDLRSGRRWVQKLPANAFIVKNASVGPGSLDCDLLDPESGLDFAVSAQVDRDESEFVVEVSAKDQRFSGLSFPPPFAGDPGDYLVVPMNEGISYPVDDASIPPMRLIAYGGHGICMAFFGVTDGAKGQMAIIETPDDASIRIDRVSGHLAIFPQWDPQLGRFGYTRRLRYVFFDKGGHVAMAKRYRQYARQIGRFKTLAQKRDDNPNVDRLIGAVNVWCWDHDAVEIVKEMQTAGITRILWSNAQSPDNLKSLNAFGVLTSRYDIFQDVMAPTNFPRLRWIHPDWTTNAWPKDIILDRRGNWIKGWGVEARDGSLVPCGVLCDRFGPLFARERIPADLTSHPYLCRFIDTTTAAPWNECYSPDHPMTRTESRQWKMELLRYISQEKKLVTGSETGHDAAVPFVHYFEGMLSLGPYRVPDAGRRMSEIRTNVPEPVAKFQLGQKYRLPLWELVYHDCVVAHWYWGDYNNKLPSLWDKRDLFNVLYGVPPMFMFDRQLWNHEKPRFVRSYETTCPLARRVGYEEMTDHRFLTRDRNVQQTSFADGTRVIVNFGDHSFPLAAGKAVEAMGFLITGP